MIGNRRVWDDQGVCRFLEQRCRVVYRRWEISSMSEFLLLRWIAMHSYMRFLWMVFARNRISSLICLFTSSELFRYFLLSFSKNTTFTSSTNFYEQNI